MGGSEIETFSDEEIEGVEMDDDCDEAVEKSSIGEGDELMDTMDDGPEEDVADGEDDELNEVCEERMKLMEAERAKVLNEVTDAESRLQYLLAQSDVFAHFLAGSVAAAAKKNKRRGGASSGGRSGGERMSEADEDAALVETAQSKRKVVRLDRQPSILAPHCKMHPYQLEGLNWLIKLHDHGINGEIFVTQVWPRGIRNSLSSYYLTSSWLLLLRNPC